MYHDPTTCYLCTNYYCCPSQLGVLKEMWDAWTPAQDINKTFLDEHYEGLLADQCSEIEEHFQNNEPQRALYEMVDIISVAMNWLRRHGVECPTDLARLISERVELRYEGKTLDIIKRDMPRFGPTAD